MKLTFTIGYLRILDHLTLPIAQMHDGLYFKNLTLKPRLFKNWKSLERALIEKTINGAFILAPLAMKLYHDHRDIKVVLLGHREGQVLVIKTDINDIKELKGKVVFIPHIYSTHHLLLSRILQDADLSIKDVNLKIGSPDIKDAVNQLAQDKIQAFIIAEPMGTEATKRGVGTIATLSHTIKTHHIDCVLVLQKELVNHYKDACQELVDSLVKAGMFINAYPRQAAEVGEVFLQSPKKLLVEALTHDKGHILYWDLLPRIEDFEELQHIAVREMKLWPSAIDLTNLVYPNFAQHAYREWTIDLRRETHDKGKQRVLSGNFAEAAVRFKHFFNNEIKIAGIQFIRPGERYPSNVERGSEKLSFAFLEDMLQCKEYVILSAEKNIKGIAFLQPSTVQEPNLIMLELTEAQAHQCIKALHFGADDFKTLQFEKVRLGEILIKAELDDYKKPCLFKHGEKVLYLLGFQQFKFLVLLLHYF